MIRINQLKLSVFHTDEDLKDRAAGLLRVRPDHIHRVRIVRRSIDARDKSDLKFVYTVDVEVPGEKKILIRCRDRNIFAAPEVRYHFPEHGDEPLDERPVIIGFGPAGIFCAWMLAKHGYRPVVLERGEEATKRRKTVESFWNGGRLDPDSNVQFGEGGAGTFSDGKLNTGVHDRAGRNAEVLRRFVKAGAPENILFDAKPHVGTDRLVEIVQNLRAQIVSFGGTVRFRKTVTDFMVSDGRVRGVVTADGEKIPASVIVLAPGHSARDTFTVLCDRKVMMQQKPFAVGLRVQHPQSFINHALYGENAPDFLGAAPYKLTHMAADGRGVYSFCMCPGGYIVNASSEEGKLAVNGMSYSDRSSGYADSAIVTAVRPEDFSSWHHTGTDAVLDGMYFQRELEERAFREGEGSIPVQRYADFLASRGNDISSLSSPFDRQSPCVKGAFRFGRVDQILPDRIYGNINEGMASFDRIIPGFAGSEALFAGIESRTSSPVRIVRDDNYESSVKGLYPCGEGAGYAGGIVSAAIDGIRTAEKIAEKYRPFS